MADEQNTLAAPEHCLGYRQGLAVALPDGVDRLLVEPAPAYAGARFQLAGREVRGAHAGQTGKLQRRLRRGGEGFAPQSIQACHGAKVGKLPRGFERFEEVSEVLAVQQQPRVAGWRCSSVDGGRGTQPVCADQTFEGWEVVAQCIDATFEYGIAIHLEARLFSEALQRRGRAVVEGFDEGVLEGAEGRVHGLTCARSRIVWARSRSASRASKAGRWSSRSISVGLGPIR